MFTVEGQVLEVRHFSGDNYAFYLGTLLVGKADLVKVKFDPRNYSEPLPSEGERVSLQVRCGAYTARNGSAALGVEALAPVASGARKAA